MERFDAWEFQLSLLAHGRSRLPSTKAGDRGQDSDGLQLQRPGPALFHQWPALPIRGQTYKGGLVDGL